MADLKLKYANAATITISPASLASDANLLAGRESDAVDNGTNLYDDVLVSGKITTGTGPATNGEIQVYVYAAHDETPTYQDVFDGTDSNESVTSAGVRVGVLRLLAAIRVENTSDRTYYIAPTSVAALFGGVLPRRWGLFVVHSTNTALHATAGNHEFKYTGIHYQSVG